MLELFEKKDIKTKLVVVVNIETLKLVCTHLDIFVNTS